MSSSDLGGLGFGEPGVDAGLEGGVAGEATFDAGEPLGGDAELIGDDTQREAGLRSQLAEDGAAGRQWERTGDGPVDLAGDVTLETTHDLSVESPSAVRRAT